MIFMGTDMNLEYTELIADLDFVSRCDILRDRLAKIEKYLAKLLPLKEQYHLMSPEAQVELDLVLVFMLNALHWINMRIDGEDLSSHRIRGELVRIRDTMVRWQQYKDRKSRPSVDVPAAKRFIRNGLYDHNGNDNPPNKKTRFLDDDE